MPDDDLTPADEQQVRRLLAEARHDEPMPDDVADRLDGVLARLRDDRPAGRPVVDHAARQRRSRVRTWVLAAAAVVVLGVGANQVDWSSTSADDAGSGADSSAAMESDDDAAPAASPDPEMAAGGSAGWQVAQVQLTSEGFGDEVQDFRSSRDYRRAHRSTLTGSEVTNDDAYASGDLSSALCGIGNLGRGHRVPVRYDGERAWLVFRPVRGETQVVDLYLCGLGEPTRSITLPAP